MLDSLILNKKSIEAIYKGVEDFMKNILSSME